MKDAQFSSKAYGTHDYKEITIDGRVQFDLLLAVQVGSANLYVDREGSGLMP